LGQLPGATAVVPGGGGLPGGSTGTGGTGTGGTGTGRPAGWNGTWGMREFVAHVHKFYWNGALSAGEIDALTAAGGTCRSIARNAMYSSRNPYRYNATQDESFNAAKVYLRVSYRALYQREADSAGFNSWFNYGKNVAENAEDGNAGITAVENGMLNSNEFKNVCAKSGLAY
jgi:hypothetical protein